MSCPCPFVAAACLAIGCGTSLAGCAANAQAPATAPKPHHDEDGFRNPDGSATPKPLSELFRRKWQAWREGVPKPPQQATPVVAPELAALRANTAPGRPSATWI